MAAPGSRSEGFKTKVLPVTMARGNIHRGIIAGKLNLQGGGTQYKWDPPQPHPAGGAHSTSGTCPSPTLQGGTQHKWDPPQPHPAGGHTAQVGPTPAPPCRGEHSTSGTHPQPRPTGDTAQVGPTPAPPCKGAHSTSGTHPSPALLVLTGSLPHTPRVAHGRSKCPSPQRGS